MGSLKIGVSLDVSGPLSDGRAEKAVGEWQERTTQALADEAVKMLGGTVMDKGGRSHGAFRENLHEVRKTRSDVTVPGPMIRGVTWAPWLEGTSTRNRSTQFPGYHVFSRTRAGLSQRATEIGQRVLDEVMGEMGSE
jgi:hypothetical protein